MIRAHEVAHKNELCGCKKRNALYPQSANLDQSGKRLRCRGGHALPVRLEPHLVVGDEVWTQTVLLGERKEA